MRHKYILALIIGLLSLNACTKKNGDHIDMDDHETYHHQHIHESLTEDNN